MAGTPIAYSEITILDLIDTATYIYYAKDENGTGATIAPGANTKYIGIYSGPPFEGGQPQTPPVETEWSKYVGDKGDKGDKGDDGAQFFVETNAQEMYYFYTSNGLKGNVNDFEISLYRLPKTDESIITLNSENCTFDNNIGIDVSDLYSFGQKAQAEGEEENIIRPKTLFFSLNKFLEQIDKDKVSSCIFTFTYKEDGVEVIQNFAFRPGASVDMAKFNVTATNINAAVGSSALKFDTTGLSIYGAGFSIYNKGGEGAEQVLYADDKGELHIKGHITATDGSFRGKITATDATFEKGKIGGFTIAGDRLYSQDASGKEILELKGGENGSIYAKNITLGENAQIKDFIKLGEAFLYNPDENDSKLLQSGNILINDDGTAKFGTISIDGDNSKIYGNGFSITPTEASFSNITVSARINTAVFNTSSTQAVGSAMLFMPSYKIKQVGVTKDSVIDYTSVILEDDVSNFSNGMLVWAVVNNDYQLLTVESVNIETKTVKFKETISGSPIAIVTIGKDTDLISAFNGSDNFLANKKILPRGLTLTKLDPNQELPNLFLGDLSSLDENNISGFGLYADTVYLNGSLTTKAKNNTYAGVNTLNGVSATIFKEEDKTNIIFWAGAANNSVSSIQGAPFQVTEAGSVYASRAYLTNSLLVGGEIKGSDIYAARIHGWDPKVGKEAGLSIYDLNNGISFKTGYNTPKEKEVFNIGTSGFYTVQEGTTSTKYFISIDDERSKVQFVGDSFKTNNTGSNGILSITTTQDNIPILSHEIDANRHCGFYFKSDKTSFQIHNGSEMTEKMILSKEEVKFNDNIVFSGKMEYKKTNKGYDLYIISQEEKE